MYGQYNPYMGATPQMQQRLNYLQQQQQQMYQPTMQQPMPMALKGRIVTDEAKAAQIDLDGTSTFFPCPAEGKIYEKSIDLNGTKNLFSKSTSAFSTFTSSVGRIPV